MPLSPIPDDRPVLLGVLDLSAEYRPAVIAGAVQFLQTRQSSRSRVRPPAAGGGGGPMLTSMAVLVNKQMAYIAPG